MGVSFLTPSKEKMRDKTIVNGRKLVHVTSVRVYETPFHRSIAKNCESKGSLTEKYCLKAAKEKYDFIHEASNLNICNNLNPMIDQTTQDVCLIILLCPIKI